MLHRRFHSCDTDLCSMFLVIFATIIANSQKCCRMIHKNIDYLIAAFASERKLRTLVRRKQDAKPNNAIGQFVSVVMTTREYRHVRCTEVAKRMLISRIDRKVIS